MKARASSFLIAIAILSACAPAERKPEVAPPLSITVADSGINTPESVLYDASADAYLVSNINGSPFEKDNNGFITRLSANQGQMAALKWIEGGAKGVTLHAPKGMGMKGDTLFVADIDAVRLFDRTTGAPLGSRTVRGATFLNDIAIGPDGTVYITDSGYKPGPNGTFAESGQDALYRFGRDGRAEALVKDPNMGRPNGIFADSTGIMVVTYGSGEIYRVDARTGGRTDLPKPPKGQLDGIEQLADGSYLISSWEGQAIYRLQSGAYTTVIDSVATPADIGYDASRKAVLIPIMSANQIQIREVR